MSNQRPAAERLAELVEPHVGRPLSQLELVTLATRAYQDGFADGRKSPPAIVRIGPANAPELET